MGASCTSNANRNIRSLLFALALTSSILIIEFIGGLATGSLALLSDAAHMLTDVAALIISIAAIQIAKYPANTQKTFGYYRFEILAAAFNATMLFVVAMYIIYEAYYRLKSPPTIHSTGMLIIAILGLLANLISMRLLVKEKDKSLNIKSAYLEVWSDMLGSLGVIIGAIILKLTNWVWVDSAIAILIGLWVLPRTWILLKQSLNILLEGVPEGIDVNEVIKAMSDVEGVLSVHELHVWALTSGKNSLTCHIVCKPSVSQDKILIAMEEILWQKFAISHTTLQCETRPCKDSHEKCNW